MAILNPSEVVKELGIASDGELLQVLGVEWELSQQSMPSWEIPFLSSGFVTEVCKAMSLPPDGVDAALFASRGIAASTALKALFWHFHHCLFPGYPMGNMLRWPSLAEALGDVGDMFYPLVVFSELPKFQDINRRHSVPLRVVSDTLSDVNLRMSAHRKKMGRWGLTVREAMAVIKHFSGEFYQLGRLQFHFGSFGYKLRAFRHRGTGTVVALSESDVRYLANGQIDGPGRIYDTSGAWISQLTFTNNEIIGHPILPTGRILQRRVHLAKAQWRQVLASGDPVLIIHIPAGSPMTYNLCGESFRTALKFFPRHFPEKPFVCFCTSSRILDSQLEELLPSTSNMVRFQKEVYLFPFLSNDLHLLEFAFGGYIPEDLTKAPRDSTLQRALLDYFLAGGHLCASAGGCFLFPEDFRWGAQIYRRQKLLFLIDNCGPAYMSHVSCNTF